MKGSEKILQVLNRIMNEEFTGFTLYLLCAKIWKHWDHDSYRVLKHKAYLKKHDAGETIERILFLEGSPVVEVAKVVATMNIESQFNTLLSYEMNHRKSYIEAIELCYAEKDFVTAQQIIDCMKYVEANINWIERQILKVQYIGVKTYISSQKPPDIQQNGEILVEYDEEETE